MDQFIGKMVQSQGKEIELRRWSDWLALDLSVDMTYSHDWGQVRDGKYKRASAQI